METADDLLGQLDGIQVPALDESAEQIQPAVAAVPVQVLDPPVMDIRAHVRRHEAILDEILQAYRSDRTEAQEAINLIRGVIDDNITKGQRVPDANFDSLVKALEVKANTVGNTVRALDSISKLIASTKAGVQINNTVAAMANSDLIKVLDQPPDPDDP